MTDLVGWAEKHQYQELFIRLLHWSRPDLAPVSLRTEDGTKYTAVNVSSYRGIRVWVCDALPGSAIEAQIDRLIAQRSTDRLVIFYDEDAQVWRWPARRTVGGATTSRLTTHRHRTGQPNPKFEDRLEAIRLPLDRPLDANAVLSKVRAAFDVESRRETRQASKLMARMYEQLQASGVPEHDISVTLARLLFLMFGDDTEMWAPNLFQSFISYNTRADGSDIGGRISDLFDYLDTPPPARPSNTIFEGFPYINGGIFSKRITLPVLSSGFRDAVLAACAPDWSGISPAIFGSMFQSVRDAQTRRELGEHYTSEENILKTLNPLFLDELRQDLDRASTMKNESLALRRLWTRLGDIRFLDPACGCGNFIIVAYRELRDLELQIMERLRDITGDAQLSFDPTLELKVSLDHFYGIEIDEWPAKIAETAMFLIDRQCDLKLKERFGEAPQRLPIQTQTKIFSGRSALELDWRGFLAPSEDVVIAGNPPFLGISLRSAAQTRELQTVWGAKYHGTLDYVTGWHAKTLDYFRETAGRWAFVATSSITQGEAVAPLFGPIFAAGWRIKFAHRTFRWTSEASGQAAVHCVIIGFAKDVDKSRLFVYATPSSAFEERTLKNISPYLTDGPTVIVTPATRPLNPQLGEVTYGNKPTDGGWLIVEPDDYDDVMSDPVAAKYVRPYVGARELLHGGSRHCLWLTDMKRGDVARSRVLSERLEGVRSFRADSRAASTREAATTPHLFRQIAQPLTAYLCIPAHVSEVRPYFLAARFSPDVITSNANFLAEDGDGFMFALISSSMFMTWQRTVGGRLESRLRFNKLLTWNTFPLPSVDRETRSAIIKAGQAVLYARSSHPTLSLAGLYDPSSMPDELLDAHQELDRRVDKAFGLRPANSSELERQDVLFAAYQRLTAPLVAPRARGSRRQ